MGLTGKLRSFVIDQKCIPWSVSRRLEQWRETSGRDDFPALYQLWHFGRLRDILQPITHGPRHHFFGYYDKSPWSVSGDLIAAHGADFNDRPPGPLDTVRVGVIHRNEGSRFEPLGETSAWNWQQGAMLQWHPARGGGVLVHNDRRGGRFAGVARNLSGKELAVYRDPIYAIAPDGRTALSLNFARLFTHRPGYGYAGLQDPWASQFHPKEDGIRLLDLDTGDSRLVVSLSQLATMSATPEMKSVHHWVNHIQISPQGTRFAFFHIWRVGKEGWAVRLYTCKMDGTELDCLLESEFVSHYDWMDEKSIFVWARLKGLGGRFVLCNLDNRMRQIVGDGVLTEDGHGTFSPNRHWILNDTYPDTYGMRTLMLYRMKDGVRTDLSR